MNLYDDIQEDVKDIYEGADEATVPILITSPPIEVRGIPANTEFGTLDPEDVDNHIRAFMTDHYTQYNPDTGNPQEALNASITLTLKTLLDKGIIPDTSEPDIKDWKVAWLDPTGGQRRDFLVIRKHPSRSLSIMTIILGEIDITE